MELESATDHSTVECSCTGLKCHKHYLAKNLNCCYGMMYSRSEADLLLAESEATFKYMSREQSKVRVYGKWREIPRQQVRKSLVYKQTCRPSPPIVWATSFSFIILLLCLLIVEGGGRGRMLALGFYWLVGWSYCSVSCRYHCDWFHHAKNIVFFIWLLKCCVYYLWGANLTLKLFTHLHT